ncbi:MAG: HIT domain-containing protein [Candidatus Aenigmatarchaeota archaeon]
MFPARPELKPQEYRPQSPEGYTPNCIFCKIAAGEVPAFKVFENEKYLAFLDINPLNPGHTLVVPKAHYRWVWDSKDITGYFSVVQKVANALRKALETEWVVSLVIGEAVEHAHVQLIPRFEDDGHGGAINFAARKQVPKEQFEHLQGIIKEAFGQQ